MVVPPLRSTVTDHPQRLAWSRPAALMGIVNATPDSFSDGGRCQDPQQARAAAARMIEAGAGYLDIGGESTRPGAEPVAVDVEIDRVLPVLAAVVPLGVPVSIDTRKAAVARAAIAAGAAIVNDVSGGRDADLLGVVADAGVPIVLMHMRGDPRTMQRDPVYADVVAEVVDALIERMTAATAAGIHEDAIIVDPGIGFGKTMLHNLALLHALPRLHAELGRPVMIGISRKAFLASAAGVEWPPAERDGLAHLLHAELADQCEILRVHDVAGAAAAIALRRAWRGAGDA